MRIAVFAFSLAAALLAASGLAHAGCGFAINPPPALAKAMEDCQRAEEAVAKTASSIPGTTGKTIITTITTTTTTTTDDKPKVIIIKQEPPPAVTCVRRHGYYTVPSYYGYETLVHGMRTVCTPPQVYSGYSYYYDDDLDY